LAIGQEEAPCLRLGTEESDHPSHHLSTVAELCGRGKRKEDRRSAVLFQFPLGCNQPPRELMEGSLL
jgi:hypothetical protein